MLWRSACIASLVSILLWVAGSAESGAENTAFAVEKICGWNTDEGRKTQRTSAADLLLLEYIRGLDGAVQSKAITVDEDTCRIADWKRFSNHEILRAHLRPAEGGVVFLSTQCGDVIVTRCSESLDCFETRKFSDFPTDFSSVSLISTIQEEMFVVGGSRIDGVLSALVSGIDVRALLTYEYSNRMPWAVAQAGIALVSGSGTRLAVAGGNGNKRRIFTMNLDTSSSSVVEGELTVDRIRPLVTYAICKLPNGIPPVEILVVAGGDAPAQGPADSQVSFDVLFAPTLDLIASLPFGASINHIAAAVQIDDDTLVFLPGGRVGPDGVLPNKDEWEDHFDTFTLSDGCLSTFEVSGVPKASSVYVSPAGEAFIVVADADLGRASLFRLYTRNQMSEYPASSSTEVKLTVIRRECVPGWSRTLAYYGSRGTGAIVSQTWAIGDSAWGTVLLVVCLGVLALCVSYLISASVIIRRVEGIWRMPIGTRACNTLTTAAKEFCSSSAAALREWCLQLSQIFSTRDDDGSLPNQRPYNYNPISTPTKENSTYKSSTAFSGLPMASKTFGRSSDGALPPITPSTPLRTPARKNSDGRLQQVLALSAHAERQNRKIQAIRWSGLPSDHPADPGYRLAMQDRETHPDYVLSNSFTKEGAPLAPWYRSVENRSAANVKHPYSVSRNSTSVANSHQSAVVQLQLSSNTPAL